MIGPQDIYYWADQRNSSLQIADLAGEIERVITGFAGVRYPSWEAILSTFDARAPRTTTLVLDEFPYLVQMATELPGILQKFIDKKHKINIVICGSSQRMMQGLVLDSSAPLYGRAHEIIKLYPLGPGWIQQALGISGAGGVEAYSIWGGIPRYWELVKNYHDQSRALKELLFDRNGPLHDEPSRMLIDDMQSAVQASSLLSLIANGCNKISEIAARIQIPSTSLARPLSNLIDLGYIKRELPFGESIKSTKRTLYKINDPFLSYWYKFIQPNKSLLERNLIEEVYEDCEKKLSFHVAEIWENLARESTTGLSIDGQSWKPGKRWWGPGRDGKPMEIDIVADSFDGKTLLFGEAKWEDRVDEGALFKKLDHCVDNCPMIRGKKVIKAVWLKKKPTSSRKDRIVLGAEEVLTSLR